MGKFAKCVKEEDKNILDHVLRKDFRKKRIQHFALKAWLAKGYSIYKRHVYKEFDQRKNSYHIQLRNMRTSFHPWVDPINDTPRMKLFSNIKLLKSLEKQKPGKDKPFQTQKEIDELSGYMKETQLELREGVRSLVGG